MDQKRTDLRTALGELAAEESAGRGPHVGLKRLTAYHQDTLPAADRERVQEHLSLCPRCTGLLRELQSFAAAAAATGDAGPESLRQAAWDSLARRLPEKTPVVRPIATAARGGTPRRFSPFVLAAAALLLAAVGFSLWAVATVRQERQRVTRLEQRLKERDASVAALERSFAEAERRLATRGETQDAEKEKLAQKVAELSAALAEIRAKARGPERRDQLARIDVSIAPRFALRGQAPPDGQLLRPGGAVNPVRTPPGKGLALALSLAGQSDYREYRLELLDRNGALLWAGRRPGSSLLGDIGTTVSIKGLGSGLYRLRVEGLEPDGGKLLAEYVLEVEPR